MESWENIILQWINCLYPSTNRIQTIDELQNGKIYYNLIDKIIPWNSKKSNENHRAMVLNLLRDEYPNFPIKNDNCAISDLCIASLVLSRLSLDPFFHKMLCTNVDDDVQIKIKSILETVYSLDKSITEEDLCNLFFQSNKKHHKLLGNSPKFILDEFIDNPVDTLTWNQSQQIQQLKIKLESMEFENSDLVEDIAAQDKQIKDLQKKLQNALEELKTIRSDNSELNSTNSFIDSEDLEAIYEKELKRFQSDIHELQTDNNKLKDEKKALSTKVKELYLEKYQELKEKNEIRKKEIESIKLNKIQEKQIKDLISQNKILQFNINDPKTLETFNLNKLESLENSVKILKSKNYQLKQEKQALIDQAKFHKEKYCMLKLKLETNERTISSLLLTNNAQERQIKELKNKLYGALSKLKVQSKVNNNNSNNNNTHKKNNKIIKQ